MTSPLIIQGADTSFHEYRLSRLESALRVEIDRGHCTGAAVLVARHGVVAMMGALGRTTPTGREYLRVDNVFNLFSGSKAFTNVLVFQAIERGDFALTSRISELIPEFSGHGRDAITIAQLLTHRSGLPPLFALRAGMYIDRLDEVIAAIVAVVYPARLPCQEVCYSPMIAHALLGEAVRRADRSERSFREIARQDVFAPLEMNHSSFGIRTDLRERHVVPRLPSTGPQFEHLGRSNYGPNGAFEEEDAEMPWVGAVSTVEDLFRFTEMLRQGGLVKGIPMLSRAMLDLATTNHTGEDVNQIYAAMRAEKQWQPWPAYYGLGFQLRGTATCPHHFGTLASPGTYGHTGLGSSVFWVDPVRDTTFVCLTAGVIREADNIGRFQRLSDMVHSAVR